VNIMIDLETLGTKPGSVVLSIGAVVFAEDCVHLGTPFYDVIRVESSLKAGLTIDASTLLWWSKQDRTVYQEALGTLSASPLADVLQRFNSWLEFNTTPSSVKVWGNGADFDLTLLLACYRAVDLQAPWQFWNHRCYRTLKALGTVTHPDVRAEKTNNHNALDDARNQAEHAVALLRAMR
jgi:hypothetical protein